MPLCSVDHLSIRPKSATLSSPVEKNEGAPKKDIRRMSCIWNTSFTAHLDTLLSADIAIPLSNH